MDTSTALWTLLSYALIGLSYFAGIAFVGGLTWRMWGYFRTPMPWPAAITPAPQTEVGAVARLLANAFLFLGLFRSSKALWLGAKLFHLALLFTLLRHLRYFTYPVPTWVTTLGTGQISLYVGYLFALVTLYLLWRRLVLPRALYISGVPDYLVLLLIGGIAVTGILLRYWAHVYLVDVKAFTLGLLTLHPVMPPQHPLFLVHFVLVLGLMLYFPFGKLLHAGGVFASPTLNQAWQVQKPGKRYVNPWNERVPVRPTLVRRSGDGK